MKLRVSFAFLFLALSACGSLSIYHQPGVSVSRMQSDQLDCEVEALREAPVRTIVRFTPDIWHPPVKKCDAKGDCIVYAGYWERGHAYTVDVNRRLRSRLEIRCMGLRGYQPVTLQPCPSGIAAQVPPGATTRLPRLTEQSCVIRDYDAGTWQIVTPVSTAMQ